jgi:zinc protease
MIGRVLAAVLLLAGLARAGDEVVLPEIERSELPNGLTVLVGESHEVPLVELSLLLPVGASRDGAADAGLATLTANSLVRGAGPYDAVALARAIESIGGRIDTSVGNDATVINADFLAEDLERAVELLRLVVREPRFGADEVRRARDEQAAGVAETMEDPQRAIERCFAAALYGTHPYGRSVFGSRATLAGLDHEDVRRFHARWYRPAGATLTVVGDIDAAHAEALVRAAFGDWRACERLNVGALARVRRLFGRAARCPDVPPPPAPPVPARPRLVIVDKPDATQAQIRLGAIAMARNSPHLLPATVANTVLGGGFSSILMDELRIKRSLTYGAASGFSARLVGGDFRIVTSTKTATTVETTALARDVLDRFRREGPTREALAKAKAYLRGQYGFSLETVSQVAGRLAENAFYGLPADYLTTYRGRVAAVTSAEARRVIRDDIPAARNLTVVVLGPADQIRKPLEEALGPATVVPVAACEDAQAALAR